MKLLLLSSSTGGGHDMRARSFAQWAETPEASSLQVNTIRRQCLDDDGPLYAFGSWLYNFIQKTCPALHHIYFNALEVVPFCGSMKTMPGREAFQAFVRTAAPDIVLSTHDHLNHAFLDAARAALPEHPPLCGTYCGELAGGYGFSRRWVNPGVDFFIGAVDACTEQARRLGMAPEKLWTGGFMLNPDFWSAPQTDTERAAFLRENLHLETGRFTLLLGTGANGANNHISLLSAFARARVHPQIIALCGTNAAAKAHVEAWAQAHPQIPVCALDYQPRMRRVMECADAIFARPGTGTTSEAIQSGLPVIFNGIGGVMPQEVITVRYCRRFFETHVACRAGVLPAIVGAWMGDSGRLARVRAGVVAARPMGYPIQILEQLSSLS